MDKNLVYKSLHLHYVEGLSIHETAKEVGLNNRVVVAIASGVREPEVANDFFADRKTGDFSRSYPLPKYKKLGKVDYAMLESRYVTLIRSEGATVQDISSYFLEDLIEPNQAEKMLGTLGALQTDVQVKLLDKRLGKILDVLAQPSKWILTETGLETVFSVPVLDDNYKIIAIDLKPNRSFVIPEELWSRYTD